MNRNEYPRPQFVRDFWMNLNGEWQFAFDDDDRGRKERWYAEKKLDSTINVPFVYQSELSGINDRTPHDIVWYKRSFDVQPTKDERVILHFGAVDYEAEVYINGQHVCHHIGGNTSFSIDITEQLNEGTTQEVSVRAFDSHYDESIPRGKQFWEDESRGIWYTNSTGIWQTVWLEIVPKNYIKDVRITPLFDEGKVSFDVEFPANHPKASLNYEINYGEIPIASGTLDVVSNRSIFDVELIQNHIFRTNYHSEGWTWTPETPNLFDVTFCLITEGQKEDKVFSYFGLRKVHTEDGMVFLNNKPYYQKLVLDQGYWPSGLITAPTDGDFIKDIELAKEMGFNGCRKHQKVEDPRFLYWADKLGFIVWGECAAAAVYNHDSAERLVGEWSDIIRRDYNHPSIITWVPVNESWGVPNISFDRQQQHYTQTMYHYLKSLDPTRLVISNDGWALTDTDIVAIHNYAHGEEEETEKYLYFKDSLSTAEKLITRRSTPWPIFANGFSYKNQPILLTEFGGIGFDVSGQPGWGYTSVENKEEFLRDYRRVMEAVFASESLWGYCYTQLTDVEQEINGLLTYEREPKCDLKELAKINGLYHLMVLDGFSN
ncbi:glycoside hydrolase family 2 protein [Enterococcus sp.]|uniref:glycoside hydrolase family 2 protein n=1 Tax=Enterococcus sp. TaxID=35783 RepID=UPI00291043E9|nr:sugar-binding domain-containing protein [Enterococcus sp.]MDU5336650.1 glycoside hydrolase family 2 TIM barrel-domain containing protein [Enterococcus sp.]